MNPREVPPTKKCGRCGKPASFFFGAPYRHADKGMIASCIEHRDAAEKARNRFYKIEDQKRV